jgi:hypothetical protein
MFLINKEKCECDGHSHIHNNSDGGLWTGGPNCDSFHEGKRYCLTKLGVCEDGIRSDQFPGHEWSYVACEQDGNL